MRICKYKTKWIYKTKYKMNTKETLNLEPIPVTRRAFVDVAGYLLTLRGTSKSGKGCPSGMLRDFVLLLLDMDMIQNHQHHRRMLIIMEFYKWMLTVRDHEATACISWPLSVFLVIQQNHESLKILDWILDIDGHSSPLQVLLENKQC